MKSIIFIGTNKTGSSLEGIKAAKRLGFNVHVLTEKEKFLTQKEDFSEIDEFHLVDLKDTEKIIETILQIHSKQSITCIISFLDSFVHLAATLSNEFCQTNLSIDSMRIMEDKLLTRQFLHGKPYSPMYFIFKKNDTIPNLLKQARGKFPLIVKLPQSCGSKDVFLVTSERQLWYRIKNIQKKTPETDILIEEYLDGPQVIVEAIVHKGNINIAAIIEQKITKSERFIVTGYSISSELDPVSYNSLMSVSHEIIRDLGLVNGNCHLELRCVSENWKLIEANPRISGGVMNNLIKEAYGIDYAEQIIKVYLGSEPVLTRDREDTVCAHFMTVDSAGELIKVTGRNQASNVPGVVEVFIKPKKGDFLMPPLSMGNRCGYVLAKCSSKAETETIALDAASLIKFHIK
ncbi:ATP-grasp domain-containing protein [Peribacillus kribbensis]|uniref:ATP-grasp domain-containing protein n=1 Tax=Peribacillus kribbensis TaxID=356658 RepID=UPI00047A5EC5|nr:ATP-grasp domain-containing protein [Peribacillus kribbensis]